MFSNDLLSFIQKYKKTPNFNAAFSLEQFVLVANNIRYANKENEIFRNYLYYKCKLIEKPEEIWSNMQNFEKRILLPLYQKLIDPRNKRYNSLEIIFKLYYNTIYNSIPNSKEVIDKVQKYGSFQNTFMVDVGDTDIDICIVPKISLAEFNADYLEKLKQGIINAKLGEIKNVINNNSYILLKIKYSYTPKSGGKKIEVNIDISVHNMLPLFNTNLIRLYGLFDQRFHIMGIYLKYWAKTNNIHGALDGYLSSYALLIMMIHFLQKIVEPKVLPNLQKIPINNNYSNPVYGEEIYKYDYFGKTIEINSYYETDVERIKDYMIKVNEGKVNQETVTNLLVKFFEYYAYFYDSKQKISVHKDLVDSIKDRDDNIAFSIEDPFEITHNPGKSMTKDKESYHKFIKAMQREVNFILGGEYVKRLEIEQRIRLANSNAKNV
jgi:DNA polymerase sigma